MKRWVALALLCLFGLTACNDRSMDSIVGSEPCIVGVVSHLRCGLCNGTVRLF